MPVYPDIQRVNFSDDNPPPPSGMVGIHSQADAIPASADIPRDFSFYLDPADLPASEPPLGNPDTDGQVLSSTAAGVRSWIDPSGGSDQYIGEWSPDLSYVAGKLVSVDRVWWYCIADVAPAESLVAINRSGWVVEESGHILEYVKANAIDGNSATYWASLSLPAWLSFDLGAGFTVASRIRLTEDTTCPRMRNLDIYESNDGTTWGDPILSPTDITVARDEKILEVLLTKRYLKIACTASWDTSFGLSEVYLDAPDTPAPADDPTHWRQVTEVGGESGTVTHTAGALTADAPMFGAGSDDAKVGTKTGNTNNVATATAGAKTTGNYPQWDADGNLTNGDVPSGSVTLSDDTPLVESGTGAAGTASGVSRSDHVHPAANGGGGGSYSIAQSLTATSGVTAALDFTSWYDAACDIYDIELEGVIPSTTGLTLSIKCSTDGGANWDSGANYNWSHFVWSFAGNAVGGNNGLTSFQIAPYSGRSLVTGSNFTLGGSIRLRNPGGENYKNFTGIILCNDNANSANAQRLDVACWYKSTSAVNGIRVVISGSGTTFGGIVRIYKVGH